MLSRDKHRRQRELGVIEDILGNQKMRMKSLKQNLADRLELEEITAYQKINDAVQKGELQARCVPGNAREKQVWVADRAD